MTGGRIALLVIGSLVALIGIALAAGGGGLLIARETLRDREGFFTTSTERFATGGRALATESLSVLEGLPLELADDNLGTLRVRATSVDPTNPVFIGIARASDADRYLAGVDHDRIRNIDYDPFRVDYERRAGTVTPGPPATKNVWVASASGTGTQTLRWSVTGGTWSVVAMNADGSPGVAIDANVGAKIRYLFGIGLGLLLGGLIFLGSAVAMIYFGARRPRAPGPPSAGESARPAAVTSTTAATPSSPVVLEGHLDEGRSRWLWLVKWLLAIPHWIVLFFLWLALWVLSIVAFFAILVHRALSARHLRLQRRGPAMDMEGRVLQLRRTRHRSVSAVHTAGRARLPGDTEGLREGAWRRNDDLTFPGRPAAAAARAHGFAANADKHRPR
jgi:hypothetical protein